LAQQYLRSIYAHITNIGLFFNTQTLENKNKYNLFNGKVHLIFFNFVAKDGLFLTSEMKCQKVMKKRRAKHSKIVQLPHVLMSNVVMKNGI